MRCAVAVAEIGGGDQAAAGDDLLPDAQFGGRHVHRYPLPQDPLAAHQQLGAPDAKNAHPVQPNEAAGFAEQVRRRECTLHLSPTGHTLARVARQSFGLAGALAQRYGRASSRPVPVMAMPK